MSGKKARHIRKLHKKLHRETGGTPNEYRKLKEFYNKKILKRI